MALHELLGEALARFQLSCCLSGTKNRKAAQLEFIDQAERERQFRTNDRDIRLELMGQAEQAFNVLWVAGQAGGLFTDAAGSGHAEHLGDASGLAQLPHQRVLPATIADYQYLHE